MYEKHDLNEQFSSRKKVFFNTWKKFFIQFSFHFVKMCLNIVKIQFDLSRKVNVTSVNYLYVFHTLFHARQSKWIITQPLFPYNIRHKMSNKQNQRVSEKFCDHKTIKYIRGESFQMTNWIFRENGKIKITFRMFWSEKASKTFLIKYLSVFHQYFIFNSDGLRSYVLASSSLKLTFKDVPQTESPD